MATVERKRQPRAEPGRGRTRRRLRLLRQDSPPATAAAPAPVVGVETLRGRWAAALAAADSALVSAGLYLPPAEIQARRDALTETRESVEVLLKALARDQRADVAVHLMVRPWEARRLLRLPHGVEACVFNLDGVLVGSAELHVDAWTATFDELILRRFERTRVECAPFNPRTDYLAHIHGRPRLDGVRAFLATRGISLPEGTADDPPGAETVHGLANRKNELLARRIEEHGVAAYEGARRYLETAHDAGISCAVVSASAHTVVLLERSGLAGLVDAVVDGNTIAAEGLRSRPAPDVLLAACTKLGVEPARAAVFETTPAGVEAARAAGFDVVVAVDALGDAEALRAQRPDRMVSGLPEILAGAGR